MKDELESTKSQLAQVEREVDNLKYDKNKLKSSAIALLDAKKALEAKVGPLESELEEKTEKFKTLEQEIEKFKQRELNYVVYGFAFGVLVAILIFWLIFKL